MRKVTIFALAITGAALLALIPAMSIGQPGGGRPSFGGRGGV